MINRTIELYAIKDCSGEYDAKDAEYFDTYKEAYAHINDLDDDGHHKYHGFWTYRQECIITKKVLTPETKIFTETDGWKFKAGKLESHWHTEPDIVLIENKERC